MVERQPGGGGVSYCKEPIYCSIKYNGDPDFSYDILKNLYTAYYWQCKTNINKQPLDVFSYWDGDSTYRHWTRTNYTD